MLRLIRIAVIAIFCVAIAPEIPAAERPKRASHIESGVTPASSPVPVPTPSAKALRYYHSGNALWVVRMAWTFVLPAALFFTGVSSVLARASWRVGRKWFIAFACYATLLVIFHFLANLPLQYYRGFLRPHEYGLSNQSLTKWFGDTLKELGLAWIVTLFFLWIPFLLIRKSPRRWWLYTGLLTVPYLFASLFLLPVFVDPLFNDFGPMKDHVLESRIMALAEKSGIQGSRIFEVNKSIDTRTVNAYVSGFMSTKRIVLWDTILAKLNEDELLFVMGHEMGHYALGHVWKGGLIFIALVTVALFGVHRLAPGLLRRHQQRTGVADLTDFASLPLCVLLLQLFALILTPAGYAYSRYQEHEADRFGLEITRNNRAAALSFALLQEQNLSNPHPGPFYRIWRSTHPPIGDRIQFLNEYRPWETGQPLRYERYFSGASQTSFPKATE